MPIHDRSSLTRAAGQLEQPSFAVKVADLVGRPVTHALGKLPGVVDRQLGKALEAAMLKCLSIAIDSLEGTTPSSPARWVPRLTTAVTGGVGGLFGIFALPIELPLTTTLMLQSIADIARYHGEDLGSAEARLACLEVFALGDRRSAKRADIGYYATRSVLAHLTADLAALLVRHQAVDATSPVAIRLVNELAGRFGIAVSERAAASALPIIGAVGGATVNMMFMSHFQQIAEGHFTIRQLERRYGRVPVKTLYQSIVTSRRIGSSA
jgi:hypothetical protein